MNPAGSQPAGPWSVRTEGFFDDGPNAGYYLVDSGHSETSFFARAGWIQSTMQYDQLETFSDDSEFEFSFTTEHAIPAGGFLEIKLPDEMAFQVDDVVHTLLTGGLDFLSLNATTIAFKVGSQLNSD